MKYLLIRLSTFLGGLYFVLYFVTPRSVLEKLSVTEYHENISYGFIAVGAIAFAVGLINLFLYHGQKILLKQRSSFYSLVVIASCVVMITLSLLDWLSDLSISNQGKKLRIISDFANVIVSDEKNDRQRLPLELRQKALKSAWEEESRNVSSLIDTALQESPQRQELIGKIESLKGLFSKLDPTRFDYNEDIGRQIQELEVLLFQISREAKKRELITRVFGILIEGFFNPLGAAMFSLLGFYIASAAYRAFRISNFESALMLSSAVIVMMGQIPFGPWISPILPEIRLWLLQWPSGAAFRAISLGALVAGLILSIRIWMSLDSTSREEKR